MSVEAVAPTPVEYIRHHLTNASIGEGFWTVHVDTVIVSALLGFLIVFLGYRVTRKMEAGAPTGFQNVVEVILEFVQTNVKDAFPGHHPLIAPLALTVFLWVLLMNAMDLLPIDMFPVLYQTIVGDPGAYLKVVPTTDINTTLGLALSVFALVLYFNVKSKGFIGYIKILLFHPFGKYLVPFNLIMNLVEEVSKPISLALRLFGNIFAGELIFMLIAVIGGTLAVGFAMVFWGPVHILLDFIWIVFHLLVVSLQAFIFMVLTIVYLGMAAESEH